MSPLQRAIEMYSAMPLTHGQRAPESTHNRHSETHLGAVWRAFWGFHVIPVYHYHCSAVCHVMLYWTVLLRHFPVSNLS